MSDTIYASVDLGGTNIAAALGTAAGAIVASHSIPTHSHLGPEAVLERIGGLVQDLASDAQVRPAALGIGVPGLIDYAGGSTLFFPNFPGHWRGVPVARPLGARLGCPVYLLNDARLAALGELVYGHGRSARSMVFFTLGTGIGGGVVLDGRLRLGALGAAGEIGHQTVWPDGPVCGCGSRGCLEAVATAPALTGEGVRLLRAGMAPALYEITGGDANRVNPREMAAAAAAGDANVREAILRVARFIGIGVANIVTILHPELIVLGGGMAGLGPILFDTVRAELQARVRMFPVDGVRVEPSALGDQAAALGGIALALRGGSLETGS